MGLLVLWHGSPSFPGAALWREVSCKFLKHPRCSVQCMTQVFPWIAYGLSPQSCKAFFETSKLLRSRCLCNGKRPRSRNTGGRTGKEELSSMRMWALLVCLKWQIPFQSQQRETGAPGSHLPACGCARAGPAGCLQSGGAAEMQCCPFFPSCPETGHPPVGWHGGVWRGEVVMHSSDFFFSFKLMDNSSYAFTIMKCRRWVCILKVPGD